MSTTAHAPAAAPPHSEKHTDTDNDSGLGHQPAMADSRALAAALDTLDAATLRALLLDAAELPGIAQRIEAAAGKQRAEAQAAAEAGAALEQRPGINFDQHAASATFHLGDKYARRPPRQQVNQAYEVARVVERLLDEMVDRTRALPNRATKISAAVNIVRVYDALLMRRHDAYIPEQVRMTATYWGSKLVSVLALCSGGDLDALSDEAGGQWFQRLRALCARAAALRTLDGLEDAVGRVFVRASQDGEGEGTRAATRWDEARV